MIKFRPGSQVHLSKRAYSDDVDFHELAFETGRNRCGVPHGQKIDKIQEFLLQNA